MYQRKNLYLEDGTPKRIRCYMIKKEPKPADYITVVYTYASKAGYPVGTIVYVGMSGAPFHPIGFCQHGESRGGRFNPGGSKIKFSELPPDCQEVVKRDYAEMWQA